MYRIGLVLYGNKRPKIGGCDDYIEVDVIHMIGRRARISRILQDNNIGLLDCSLAIQKRYMKGRLEIEIRVFVKV